MGGGEAGRGDAVAVVSPTAKVDRKRLHSAVSPASGLAAIELVSLVTCVDDRKPIREICDSIERKRYSRKTLTRFAELAWYSNSQYLNVNLLRGG